MTEATAYAQDGEGKRHIVRGMSKSGLHLMSLCGAILVTEPLEFVPEFPAAQVCRACTAASERPAI